MLKSNVGQADQIVRGAVGAALVIMSGLGAIDGAWKIAAMVVGCVAVFTASAGFCPLYQLLGLDTRSTRTELQS